jgi:hypothetical protein
MFINRRQASDTLTIRLVSASITTMAARTAARAATRPHGSRQARDTLAGLQRSLNENAAERTWQPDTEYHGRAVEKRTKLALADSQAVRVALASKVLVITGGPGVGKTTLVNSILKW